MQIKLSSDNHDIISTGMVFLFGEDKDLKIEVITDAEFRFTIIMEFKNDENGSQRIDSNIVEKEIRLICYNFKDNGTGITVPVQIGTIFGKDMHLMFWSYLDGDKGIKARRVQYTIFLEK